MGVRRFGRLIGRLILLGIGLVSVTAVAVALTVVSWPRDQALPAPADAIICLGAGMSMTAGWDQPDDASARRARTCAMLHAAGVAPAVVFTGYGNSVTSAADAMYATAVAAGLPPAAGMVEPDARSTIQNADFSLAMLSDATRVIVVSDAFHLPRSWVIFRALGARDVALYAAAPLEDQRRAELGGQAMSFWVVREALAVWSNAARALAYVLGGAIGIDHDTRIGWFN